MVAAERTEINNFKYGIVKADGSFQTTTTSISNVSVLGVICKDASCSSISGYLYNGNILTSSGSTITLTYPTILASSHGYGIYFFKDGYIPYELNADYWGTNPNDPQGPFNDYLSKKEDCKSTISNLNINQANGNVEVSASVHSALEKGNVLAFIPEQIKSEYSANVNVTLMITKDSNVVFSQSKILSILGSQNQNIGFSVSSLAPGNYKAVLITTVPDAKCLSTIIQNTSSTFSITKPPECTQNSDCGSESYSDNYCKSDNVVKNHIVPTCSDGKCALTNITETVQVCENGCNAATASCIPATISCNYNSDCGIDGFTGDNFCEGESSFRDFEVFTCNNPGTAQSKCSSSLIKTLIQICPNFCSNGNCIAFNCHNDSECNDNNESTEDVCVNPNTRESHCTNTPKAITCYEDSACGTNGFIGDNFCSSNNVFQNFITFKCNNSGTTQSFCSNSTESTLKQNCGTNSCGNYGNNYCKGNSVYHSRICIDKGCAASGCFSNTRTDEQLVQTCTGGCSNGGCVNFVCHNDSECNDNNASTTDICVNPNTANSYCSHTPIAMTVCSADSDCGTPSCNNPTNFCRDNNIFQEFTFFKCNNPGTVNSFCSNFSAPQLILDCGNSSYSDFGPNFCENGSVYRSRTFYNRGCANASCFIDSSEEKQLVIQCENGCSKGLCINQGIGYPNISLLNPSNNSNISQAAINFSYFVTSNSAIAKCSLVIDSSSKLNSSQISNGTNSFIYTPLVGTHKWLVSCTNIFNRTNVSETRLIIISKAENNTNLTCVTNSQCPSTSYSDFYCSSKDIYRDVNRFSCISQICVKNVSKELIEECDYRCSGGECKESSNGGGNKGIGKIGNDEIGAQDIYAYNGINQSHFNNIPTSITPNLTNQSKSSSGVSWWIIDFLILLIILILMLIAVMVLAYRRKRYIRRRVVVKR